MALRSTSLAQCHTAGHGLSMTQAGVSPVPVLLGAPLPPFCGNQRSPRPCLHQIWRSWRSLGEVPTFHRQECFAHTSIFPEFANHVACLFSTSLPQMLNLRCCFQILFLLLLLSHWPETSSRLQPLT